MSDLATRSQGTKSRAATTMALLGGGAVLTAGLTSLAVAGQGSRIHLAIALGLSLVAALVVALVVARRRVARVPLRWFLAAAVIALPALAILGPVFALPQLRALFGFRIVRGTKTPIRRPSSVSSRLASTPTTSSPRSPTRAMLCSPTT